VITLFGRAPKEPPAWVGGLAEMVAINVAATIVCSALACLSFFGALSQIDAPEIPTEIWVFFSLLALGVAVAGAALGAAARSFPWPSVFLTPLFLGAIMGQLGGGGFSGGIRLGAFTSGVFVLGALVGRGLRHWLKVRKANHLARHSPI
jgi:hypothetical protein